MEFRRVLFRSEYETRDLPLVVPEQAPEGGVVGLQAPDADGDALPTVDTTTAPSGRDAPKAGDSAAQATMLPPTAAGGDYAVHFAAYDSSVSADTVVAPLRAPQLPAYPAASRVGGQRPSRRPDGSHAPPARAENPLLEGYLRARGPSSGGAAR